MLKILEYHKKFPSPLYQKDDFIGIEEVLEDSLENATAIDISKVEHFDKDNILKISGRKKREASGTPHPFLSLRASEGRVSFGKRVSPNHIELSNISTPTKTIHCGYSFQPRLFVPIEYKGEYYAREFTLLELAQIQSFPKEYQFFGSKNDIITQIGNAVPPVLAKVIGQKIIQIDPYYQEEKI
jgi:site-specific DNA-cytosine methylase